MRSAVLLLLGVAACGHDESISTTTVRSASPEGARVANLPEPPAERLASAHCIHERECARARGLVRADALAMSEASCRVAVRDRAERVARTMSCPGSEGFERCLDSIEGAACGSEAFSSDLCRNSVMCRE
jgi:hypothetical protein